MKRTVFFVIGLILAGTLAYFTGYYVYTSVNMKTEGPETIALQKAVTLSGEKLLSEPEEYYMAKIEQDMLMIYQMPGESLYDSVKLNGLYFSEKEKSRLTEGMVFYNLTEVFEFLENSMS